MNGKLQTGNFQEESKHQKLQKNQTDSPTKKAKVQMIDLLGEIPE